MVFLLGDLTVVLRARSGDRRDPTVPRARCPTGRLRTQETGTIRADPVLCLGCQATSPVIILWTFGDLTVNPRARSGDRRDPGSGVPARSVFRDRRNLSGQLIMLPKSDCWFI